MANRFDWHTDEESGWETPLVSPALQPARRWHGRLLLFLLLVMSATGIGYWQLQQRVAAATANVAEDVSASYRLLHQAAGRKDVELFNTLIAGGDRSWVRAQRALLAEGLLLDRWPLALRLQAAEPDIEAIIPSADLSQVELQVAQQYAVDRGQGIAETVTLRQVVTYRRGQNRWLAAPPPPDFWGEWRVADGRLLTLVYPRRDEAIALRLLADLETQWLRSCRTLPEVECPQDLRLLVRLSTDPAALATVADAPAMLSGRPNLNLPAPTLVGLPLDEAGYQALLRGYAAHVVAAVLVEGVGWSCCRQGLFHQALLDYQLSQIGLRPWPLTAAVYKEMPGQAMVGLGGLNRFWPEPPLAPLSGHAWPQVYALVDFVIHSNPGIPVAAMQRRLATADSYFTWLQQYVPLGALGNRAQQRQWLRFIQAQVEPAPLSIPLPKQDIQMLCRSSLSRSIATLYRYDMASATWTAELANRPFLFMAPLPQDEGVLLQEREGRPDRSRLLLWQDGSEIGASPRPLPAGLFRVDPAGSNLLLYTFSFSERTVSHSLLDPAACDEGDCHDNVPGVPLLSPDGRRTLLVDSDSTLWLGNEPGQALRAIGRGVAPFWLDSETYGYAHLAGSLTRSPSEIVAVSAATGEVTILLRLADLQAAVPAEVELDRLSIRAIVAAPADPDILFIALAPSDDDGGEAEAGALIFSYNRRTGVVSLRLRLDHYLSPFSPLLFSPDGRWLVLQSFARPKTLWQLHLHDVASGQTHALTSSYIFAFPGFDWSADGRWLLRVEEGFLHVLAPAHDYEQMIVHDFPGCNFAAWINKP